MATPSSYPLTSQDLVDEFEELDFPFTSDDILGLGGSPESYPITSDDYLDVSGADQTLEFTLTMGSQLDKAGIIRTGFLKGVIGAITPNFIEGREIHACGWEEVLGMLSITMVNGTPDIFPNYQTVFFELIGESPVFMPNVPSTSLLDGESSTGNHQAFGTLDAFMWRRAEWTGANNTPPGWGSENDGEARVVSLKFI